MNFYLSSYKFGNETEQLIRMLPPGSRIGHINNARDWIDADPIRRAEHQRSELEFLGSLGFAAEPLDLKDYFDREGVLKEQLGRLNGVWVSGGNTFVLRQAMRLSGFDNLFAELQNRAGFLYGGYSAGVCILCDSLKYIEYVDDPGDFPYAGIKETIWEGLNIFPYGILPHYDSDHFESEAIGKEVQRCIDNKWLFKVLRDGEVMVSNES